MTPAGNASEQPPFHLAIPVDDLAAARAFYGDCLGCREGRSSKRWIDWDFYGHQLVTHLGRPLGKAETNEVDGHAVSSFHFGVVLSFSAWEELAASLQQKDMQFVMAPTIRFKGKPGEQGTFFIQDYAGNTLEFKAFRDINQLFATD